MLCRFVDKENVSSVNVLKSSAQKGMKNKIIEQFPHVEALWPEIVPKKAGIKLVKWYVREGGYRYPLPLNKDYYIVVVVDAARYSSTLQHSMILVLLDT